MSQWICYVLLFEPVYPLQNSFTYIIAVNFVPLSGTVELHKRIRINHSF